MGGLIAATCMVLLILGLYIAGERAARTPPPPPPPPCKHDRTEPVHSIITGELLARICISCDAQLDEPAKPEGAPPVSAKQNKGRDPVKRAARRRAQREAAARSAATQPITGGISKSQAAHASGPRGRRKAREGEQAMNRDRKENPVHPLPVNTSHESLISILEDILRRVRAGDSLEGSIQWMLPENDSAPDHSFDVMAAYRIGNLRGQGGLRMINTMVPDEENTP